MANWKPLVLLIDGRRKAVYGILKVKKFNQCEIAGKKVWKQRKARQECEGYFGSQQASTCLETTALVD